MWLSKNNIEKYMSDHQHDSDAKNCGNILMMSFHGLKKILKIKKL